jgi:addiction module RelE/StbE family toxin
VKLRWSATATRELEEIFAYLQQRSPTSAKNVAERILHRARALRDFPRTGSETPVKGLHRAVVVNYPYVILYEINKTDEVLIASVRHTAQQPSTAEE